MPKSQERHCEIDELIKPESIAKMLYPRQDPVALRAQITDDNDGYIGGTIRRDAGSMGSEFGSEFQDGNVARDMDGPYERFIFGDLTFDVDAAKELCDGEPNDMIQVSDVWSQKINVDKVAAMRSTSTNPVLIAQIPTKKGLKPLLIDGHHRMYKARQEGVEELEAYVLTPEETLFILDSHPDMMTTLTKNLTDILDPPNVKPIGKGASIDQVAAVWSKIIAKAQPGGDTHVNAPLGTEDDDDAPPAEPAEETPGGQISESQNGQVGIDIPDFSKKVPRYKGKFPIKGKAATSRVRGNRENSVNKGGELERRILDPKRGSDGLFKQPEEVGPDREVVENHNRERAANHFHYADEYAGNTRTFDPDGNYRCGDCNMANKLKCLLVKVKYIDPKAGSCGDWENKCAGDPEMVLEEKSPEVAVYGVAKNGVGFGCHRCPYASQAVSPDSKGRSLYCGKFDMRVMPNACCAANGAETTDEEGRKKPIEDTSTDKEDDSDKRPQSRETTAQQVLDAGGVRPIVKADYDKQIVYCVVLEPHTEDSQGDVMTPEDIEETAHAYMAKARRIGRRHKSIIKDAYPVESYIAPMDMQFDGGPYGSSTVTKGSWVIGIKIEDPDEWFKVKSGEYKGVSIGGTGTRLPL